MNNQRAALTITRRSRASQPDTIMIRLTAPDLRITVDVSLEEFARALTGDGVPVYADAEVQERK